MLDCVLDTGYRGGLALAGKNSQARRQVPCSDRGGAARSGARRATYMVGASAVIGLVELGAWSSWALLCEATATGAFSARLV